MELASEELLCQAIRGSKPDRPPTAPLFYFFAGRYAGLTTAELVNDPRNYSAAMDRVWEDFGPWDVYYPLNAINRGMMSIAMPLKNAYPGVELPENDSVQFIEEELMTPDDYEVLLSPLGAGGAGEVLGAARREVRGWIRNRIDEVTEKGFLGALEALRDRAPSLFADRLSGPRDPVSELRGWGTLLSIVTRQLANSELDTELTLRYMRLLVRLSGRIMSCGNVIDAALTAAIAAYEQLGFTRHDFDRWRDRGVTPLFGMGLEGPFDTYSMARSMLPFSQDDLFARPDTVREASAAAADFFVAMAEIGTALTGVPRFIYACHRTSNDFISPKHFAELAFPSMRDITERISNLGITLVFHCDGKWDLNLEYLARLPEGKCVFQFDGRTDMRLARRVLGDAHCIFGDVPAAMLALGSPEEVSEYSKSLVRDIGANGRFILGAGCEIPPDAKPENVRAMLRAAFEA